MKSLAERRLLSLSIFLYKVLNNCYDVPELLARCNFRVPARVTRNHHFFAPDFHRTNYGQSSTMYQAMDL
ncbi:hypothetical protein SGI37_20295, partial [Providencia rettgeri]